MLTLTYVLKRRQTKNSLHGQRGDPCRWYEAVCLQLSAIVVDLLQLSELLFAVSGLFL